MDTTRIFINSVYFLGFGIVAAAIMWTTANVAVRRRLLFVFNGAFLILLFMNAPMTLIVIAYVLFAFMILQSGGTPRKIFFAVLAIPVIVIYADSWRRSSGMPPVSVLRYLTRYFGMPFLAIRVFDLRFNRENLKKLGARPLDLVNYLLFFPTFVSGPIIPSPSFTADVNSPKSLSFPVLLSAIKRVALGMFKQCVLALLVENLNIASFSREDLAHFRWWQVALSSYLLLIHVYFLFSGLTDVAIGISMLLGFNAPENFSRPFSSRNIAEFWRRWHISFADWFRRHVFYPLNKSLYKKVSRHPWVCAGLSLVATFTLAGLVHGTNVRFLCYGLYHAAGYLLFFAYGRALKTGLSPSAYDAYGSNRFVKSAAVALTFNFVVFGELLFFDLLR